MEDALESTSYMTALPVLRQGSLHCLTLVRVAVF